MKLFISIILSIGSLSGFGQSQNKDCNIVQFINKKYADIIQTLSPNFHPRGFYLVKNQVYDLVIDGKLYSYSLILDIKKDKFTIATKWESGEKEDIIIDTLSVLPSQNLQVRMLTINRGVGGLPFRTKKDDYLVSIIPTDTYCFAKYIPIENGKNNYMSHQYFTQYPNKYIRVAKGRAYFIDERGEFPLAKK